MHLVCLTPPPPLTSVRNEKEAAAQATHRDAAALWMCLGEKEARLNKTSEKEARGNMKLMNEEEKNE